jgi:peptide deformylase
MIRPILRHGDAALHRRARPVENIDAALVEVVEDMIATMHNAPGVGLAAPQVGVDARIFVLDVSVGARPQDLRVLINPDFVERDGMQLEEEGCLSVPGFNATVARPMRAVVRGLDRDGNPVVVEGRGLVARVLQHEMDHLDGCLFVDRLRGLRRRLIQRRIERLRRSGKW